MSFTAYPNNYDFHEETLSDRMALVTNNTTRTILHNELVYLDGYFGEVCEFDGIEANDEGYININHERTIKTIQVAAAALMAGDFIVGNVIYFIPQTNDNEGYLVDQNDPGAPAIAVGIITSASEDNDWVTFKPFVQPVGLLKFSTEDARVDDLEEAITLLNDDDTEEGSVANSVKTLAEAADFTSDGDLVATAIGAGLNEAGAAIALLNDADTEVGSVANSVKTLAESADFTSDGDISATTVGDALNELGSDVADLKLIQPVVKEISIEADATLGLAYSLATLGMAVGDRIVDIWSVASSSNAAGTMTVSHGAAGADISSALACVTAGDVARTTTVIDGTLTADGLIVTSNGADDRAKIYIMYFKA